MHDKIIMAGDNMNNVELITRENYLYLDDDHINEYLDLTEEETNKIMKNFISRKEHEQKEESKKAL